MTITSPKCFSHGLIGALLMALVSPVWALTPIEVAKLTASDEQTIYNDQFGRSVAVNGDTALIGALTDPDKAWFGGASYLFTRSGGVWIGRQSLFQVTRQILTFSEYQSRWMVILLSSVPLVTLTFL